MDSNLVGREFGCNVLYTIQYTLYKYCTVKCQKNTLTLCTVYITVQHTIYEYTNGLSRPSTRIDRFSKVSPSRFCAVACLYTRTEGEKCLGLELPIVWIFAFVIQVCACDNSLVLVLTECGFLNNMVASDMRILCNQPHLRSAIFHIPFLSFIPHSTNSKYSTSFCAYFTIATQAGADRP